MEKRIDEVVHELNGRYIVAHWDAQSAQWRSSDITERPGPEYRYSYAGTLHDLARIGIRTYATRAEAEVAARECYLIAEETD